MSDPKPDEDEMPEIDSSLGGYHGGFIRLPNSGVRNIGFNSLRLGKRAAFKRGALKRLRLGKRSVPNLRLGKRKIPNMRLGKRSWMTPASIRNASPFHREVSANLKDLLRDKEFLAHVKQLIKKDNMRCKLIKMNLDNTHYFKRTQPLPSLRLGKRASSLCLDGNGFDFEGEEEDHLLPWLSD